MEKKQSELISKFLKKLPSEKFVGLNQMGQAKVFIWFAEKGLGTELNENEVVMCFQLAHLKVPTQLGTRLRREYDVVWSTEVEKFAINKVFVHEFDEIYEKFLDTSLPDIDAFKIKPPNLSQKEISGANKNAEAYMLLYLVENSARKYIRTKMAQIFKEQWWEKIDQVSFLTSDKKIGEKHKQQNIITNIKRKAQNLKNKESANKLITQGQDYLFYCELGDLIDFIRYLLIIPGNRVVPQNNAQLISCLKTIDGIRNPVAHNRAISEEEFEILKSEHIKWCKLIRD